MHHRPSRVVAQLVAQQMTYSSDVLNRHTCVAGMPIRRARARP
jgi:hypothetical protein